MEVRERLAELVVGLGANVQPGQVLAVSSEVGKEPLTRDIARSAYRRGARFVDVTYFDMEVKRQRLLHADPSSLEYVPSWYGERVTTLGDERCSVIALTGPVTPGLFDDVDPACVGRDRLPHLKETMHVVNERLVNWTAAPCPTPGWAGLVHPDLEPDAALARLWDDIAHVCRLDEPDPAEAWRQRVDALAAAGQRLTDCGFDALHYEGPGTDLRVGLLPTSRWMSGWFQTVDGVRHLPNVPTEETFTSPDPERVDGVVRATKPLVLTGGTIVRDLSMRFEGGRMVSLDASTAADTLRELCARDEGAARLGEVALVDSDGRIGPLETTFYDTLLDENAASHIALGSGFAFAVSDADRPRVNQSDIHIDFMIGSDELNVTGITAAGERVPVLRGGDWAL